MITKIYAIDFFLKKKVVKVLIEPKKEKKYFQAEMTLTSSAVA